MRSSFNRAIFAPLALVPLILFAAAGAGAGAEEAAEPLDVFAVVRSSFEHCQPIGDDPDDPSGVVKKVQELSKGCPAPCATKEQVAAYKKDLENYCQIIGVKDVPSVEALYLGDPKARQCAPRPAFLKAADAAQAGGAQQAGLSEQKAAQTQERAAAMRKALEGQAKAPEDMPGGGATGVQGSAGISGDKLAEIANAELSTFAQSGRAEDLEAAMTRIEKKLDKLVENHQITAEEKAKDLAAIREIAGPPDEQSPKAAAQARPADKPKEQEKPAAAGDESILSEAAGDAAEALLPDSKFAISRERDQRTDRIALYSKILLTRPNADPKLAEIYARLAAEIDKARAIPELDKRAEALRPIITEVDLRFQREFASKLMERVREARAKSCKGAESCLSKPPSDREIEQATPEVFEADPELELYVKNRGRHQQFLQDKMAAGKLWPGLKLEPWEIPQGLAPAGTQALEVSEKDPPDGKGGKYLGVSSEVQGAKVFNGVRSDGRERVSIVENEKGKSVTSETVDFDGKNKGRVLRSETDLIDAKKGLVRSQVTTPDGLTVTKDYELNRAGKPEAVRIENDLRRGDQVKKVVVDYNTQEKTTLEFDGGMTIDKLESKAKPLAPTDLKREVGKVVKGQFQRTEQDLAGGTKLMGHDNKERKFVVDSLVDGDITYYRNKGKGKEDEFWPNVTKFVDNKDGSKHYGRMEPVTKDGKKDLGWVEDETIRNDGSGAVRVRGPKGDQMLNYFADVTPALKASGAGRMGALMIFAANYATLAKIPDHAKAVGQWLFDQLRRSSAEGDDDGGSFAYYLVSGNPQMQVNYVVVKTAPDMEGEVQLQSSHREISSGGGANWGQAGDGLDSVYKAMFNTKARGPALFGRNERGVPYRLYMLDGTMWQRKRGYLFTSQGVVSGSKEKSREFLAKFTREEGAEWTSPCYGRYGNGDEKLEPGRDDDVAVELTQTIDKDSLEVNEGLAPARPCEGLAYAGDYESKAAGGSILGEIGGAMGEVPGVKQLSALGKGAFYCSVGGLQDDPLAKLAPTEDNIEKRMASISNYSRCGVYSNREILAKVDAQSDLHSGVADKVRENVIKDMGADYKWLADQNDSTVDSQIEAMKKDFEHGTCGDGAGGKKLSVYDCQRMRVVDYAYSPEHAMDEGGAVAMVLGGVAHLGEMSASALPIMVVTAGAGAFAQGQGVFGVASDAKVVAEFGNISKIGAAQRAVGIGSELVGKYMQTTWAMGAVTNLGNVVEALNQKDLRGAFKAGVDVVGDAGFIVGGAHEKTAKEQEQKALHDEVETEKAREQARTQAAPKVDPVADAYKLLGVEPTASMEQVAAARRRLANEVHPDKNLDKSAAEQAAAGERMREVNAAYDLIKKSQRANAAQPDAATDGGTASGAVDPVTRRAADAALNNDFPGGIPEEMAQKVQQAHEEGRGELGKDGVNPAAKGNYTKGQLKRKAEILRRAGFDPAQTRALMEAGVVGDEPAIGTSVVEEIKTAVGHVKALLPGAEKDFTSQLDESADVEDYSYSPKDQTYRVKIDPARREGWAKKAQESGVKIAFDGEEGTQAGRLGAREARAPPADEPVAAPQPMPDALPAPGQEKTLDTKVDYNTREEFIRQFEEEYSNAQDVERYHELGIKKDRGEIILKGRYDPKLRELVDRFNKHGIEVQFDGQGETPELVKNTEPAPETPAGENAGGTDQGTRVIKKGAVQGSDAPAAMEPVDLARDYEPWKEASDKGAFATVYKSKDGKSVVKVFEGKKGERFGNEQLEEIQRLNDNELKQINAELAAKGIQARINPIELVDLGGGKVGLRSPLIEGTPMSELAKGLHTEWNDAADDYTAKGKEYAAELRKAGEVLDAIDRKTDGLADRHGMAEDGKVRIGDEDFSNFILTADGEIVNIDPINIEMLRKKMAKGESAGATAKTPDVVKNVEQKIEDTVRAVRAELGLEPAPTKMGAAGVEAAPAAAAVAASPQPYTPQVIGELAGGARAIPISEFADAAHAARGADDATVKTENQQAVDNFKDPNLRQAFMDAKVKDKQIADVDFQPLQEGGTWECAAHGCSNVSQGKFSKEQVKDAARRNGIDPDQGMSPVHLEQALKTLEADAAAKGEKVRFHAVAAGDFFDYADQMAADGHPRPAGMAALREGMKVNDPVTGNTIEALHMVTVRGRFVYEGQEYVVVKDPSLRDPKIYTRDAFNRASVSNGIVVMESGEGTFKENPSETDPAVVGEKIHGDHTDTSGSPEEQNRQRDRWQRFKVDKQGRITPVVDGHVDLVDGQVLARLNPKTGDIEVDGTPQFSTQDKVRTAIKQWAKKNDATRIGVPATEAQPAEAQALAAERAKSQQNFVDQVSGIGAWFKTKLRGLGLKAERTPEEEARNKQIYEQSHLWDRTADAAELRRNAKDMENENRLARSGENRQCNNDCGWNAISNASNGQYSVRALENLTQFDSEFAGLPRDGGLPLDTIPKVMKKAVGKKSAKNVQGYSYAEFLKVLETRRPPPAGVIGIHIGTGYHALVWLAVTDPIGGKAYAVLRDSNAFGYTFMPLDDFAQVITGDVWAFEPPQPSGP